MRTLIDRRTFVVASASTLMMSYPVRSTRHVTDSANRKVELPDRITRVFAAGGPAAVAVYVLKPDSMVGWPREMREEEKRYVVPSVRDLPGVGLITERGDTANIELVLKTKPDLVVDFGSTRDIYVSLVTRRHARWASKPAAFAPSSSRRQR